MLWSPIYRHHHNAANDERWSGDASSDRSIRIERLAGTSTAVFTEARLGPLLHCQYDTHKFNASNYHHRLVSVHGAQGNVGFWAFVQSWWILVNCRFTTHTFSWPASIITTDPSLPSQSSPSYPHSQCGESIDWVPIECVFSRFKITILVPHHQDLKRTDRDSPRRRLRNLCQALLRSTSLWLRTGVMRVSTTSIQWETMKKMFENEWFKYRTRPACCSRTGKRRTWVTLLPNSPSSQHRQHRRPRWNRKTSPFHCLCRHQKLSNARKRKKKFQRAMRIICRRPRKLVSKKKMSSQTYCICFSDF